MKGEEKKKYNHDWKTSLPVLLDVSVVRNAEIAVSAEAEQAAAFAFELTAVDVSETALLWYPLLLVKDIHFRKKYVLKYF